MFQLIIYTKWMKEDNKYSKKVPKERLLFVMSPQTPLKKGLILWVVEFGETLLTLWNSIYDKFELTFSFLQIQHWM